jgi:hypothetical protein
MQAKMFSEASKNYFPRWATSLPAPNHLGNSGLTEAAVCLPVLMNLKNKKIASPSVGC